MQQDAQNSPSAFTWIVSTSLAAVLVAGFFWPVQVAAVSNLPWKVEFVAGCVILALALWQAKPIAGLRRGEVPWSIRLLLLFTCWNALSMLWSRSFGWSAHFTLVWLVYLATCLIGIALQRRSCGTASILNAFGIVAAVLFLSAVIDVAAVQDFSQSEGVIRIKYGKYAEMTTTFAPLFGAAVITAQRQKRRIFAAAAWCFSLAVTMLSLSKGAFVASIVGHVILFTCVIFLSQDRTRKAALVTALSWIAFTVIFQAGVSSLTPIPSTTEYLSGAADHGRTTSIFRIFAWNMGREMVTLHPVAGVGAGNFGIAFNDARASLAAKFPISNSPELAEDHMVERAHNEPLQILAELGPVGLLIFVSAFAAFLFSSWRRVRQSSNSLPPIFWGAFAGMAAFAASSMVSSFSFRAVQNGIAFFLVFSIAVCLVAKDDTGHERPISKLWSTLAIVGPLLLIVFTVPKGLAEYQIARAERTENFETAAELYRSALRLDRDNAQAYYYFASRLAEQGKDPAAAGEYLRKGIERGIGVTVTYSTLAKYQEETGDISGARDTLAQAVTIFPNSVFIRIRYSEFLRSQGDPAGAAREMAAAYAIDPRQAEGWRLMITVGSVAAFYRSQADPAIAAPAELLPANAALAFIDKDQIPVR